MITHGRLLTTKQRKPKRAKNSQEIYSIAELQPGDYVVHASHGIGVFEGIHKIDMHGVVKDYIKVRYAKNDTLYVPVTQLDMVSKYIGPREDANVKLNRLGGTEWQKTKARVRTAVKDMAKELIKLYADRMQAKGHAFSADSEWQRDFESHFEYDETEDQLRCIEEIKDDMEREAPMDRLLCGDVGFGKTEVALRAAFKCVYRRQAVRDAGAHHHPGLAALPDGHCAGWRASRSTWSCSPASARRSSRTKLSASCARGEWI